MKNTFGILTLLLLLTGILCSGVSYSQTDSLTSAPKVSNRKIGLLLAKGNQVLQANPDKALDIGLQALVLSKKQNDTEGEAYSLMLLAEANFKLNQLVNAIRYYNRALSIYEKKKRLDIQLRILIGIANVYDAANNIELAIKSLEKGIGVYNRIENVNLYINLLEKLSDLYLKQGNYKKAKSTLKQIVTLTNRADGNKVIFRDIIKTRSLMHLGLAQRNLGELREGLISFKKATELSLKNSDSLNYAKALREIGLSYYLIQKLDSAAQYFNLSFITSQRLSDTVGVVQSIQGLGDVAFEQGRFNAAINFYNRQLQIARKINDIPSSIASLVKISRSYFAMGDYPGSTRYLNKALRLAKTNNLTESKADVYRYLAMINEAQGRYKDALDFYKLWSEIRDSIYSDETGQRLAKLQILYEITQKEKENEILRQNSEIQNLQLAKTRYQTRILILIIFIVTILFVSLIMVYRQKQKEIRKQKETEQRIKEINKELERRMIQEVKKQEKQQQLLAQKSKLESLGILSAGIAHEINQPLGGISMGLDNLLLRVQEKHLNEEYLKEKINSLFENVERIKKIIDHIRYFSRTQKPVSFVRVDINEVVRSALFMVQTQYQNHGITIDTYLDESIDMITADKYKLEQVLLNLLSNAKYAVDEKAKMLEPGTYQKRIEIKTWQNDRFVFIGFRDNGMGIPKKHIDKIFDPFFTTKGEEKGTGLGLSISYGFIKDLLGDIKVDSSAGNYTYFEISIPKE